MSDIVDVAQAVADAAKNTPRDFASVPMTDAAMFAEPVYSELLALCREVDKGDLDAMLTVLSGAIPTADCFNVGRVAILCGTLVEHGGDPTIAIRPLLDRLHKHLTTAARVAPRLNSTPFEALFADDPEAFLASRTVRFSLLATMTMICRDLPAREYARRVPGLADALAEIEPYSDVADFLLQVLALTDGMELVVLHPESRRGFRVFLQAIGSNFHLFTLLQAAVIGNPAQGFLPGVSPDAQTVAIAKGEVAPTGNTSDKAQFHFYDHFALKPDGMIDANIAASIWGEGVPADIVPFDGERIVLVGKMIFGSRSWDGGFFPSIHDALRSDIRITAKLSEVEVTDYLDRIAAAGERLRSANGT